MQTTRDRPLLLAHLVRLVMAALTMAAAAALLSGCSKKELTKGSEADTASESVNATVRPSHETEPALPVALPPTRAPILVAAWTGSSSLGYVRAEMLVEDSEDQLLPRELRIIHSDGSINRHRGQLVRIPDDFARAPGPWRAFVLVPGVGDRYRSPYPEFLALIDPQGGLRLYEFSMPDGKGACDLQPAR